MGWRRGEVWLETEVLWFREGTGAPAFAGYAPPSLPSLGRPPGFAASRRRREAWKRRRNARRARATALLVSPAVIVPLVLLRGGGGQGTVVAEDPPSLTFRLGGGTAGPASAPVEPSAERASTVPPSSPPASEPRRTERSAARAEETPTIEWRRATSVGVPHAGRLIDGTQLPVEGPGWVTWNPVTDSLVNAPNRLYGHERTIRTILSVTSSYRAANPEAPRVVVGDISFEGGGSMRDQHVSHQNGLDVDVYYPRRDGMLRAPDSPGDVDRRLAQDLLDRFVAAGAQIVFVGYSTGLRGPAGVVVPYPSHENHMHVRFPPPGG